MCRGGVSLGSPASLPAYPPVPLPPGMAAFPPSPVACSRRSCYNTPGRTPPPQRLRRGRPLQFQRTQRMCLMEITIAVVPVAGLGSRLLLPPSLSPRKCCPLAASRSCSMSPKNSPAGMERILFVTGPGKASIENHFDLNPELIQILRDMAKRTCWSVLYFERVDVRYFYTRQRELLGLGTPSCAAAPSSATSSSSSPWATRSSA